jgi:hypothetical protein
MKKILYLFSPLAVIIPAMFFSCCNPNSYDDQDHPVTCNCLLGSWTPVVIPNSLRITFTPDSMEYGIIPNGEFYAIVSKYACQASNDTLFVQTIEEKPFRILMIRTGHEKFVFAVFKGVKGTEDHIAHAFQIEKIPGSHNGKKAGIHSEVNRDIPIHPDTYILPYGFTGVFAIAYNQPDGMLPAYDSSGNKVYSFINNINFLAKVQSSPDIISYALNNMRFFYPGPDGSAIPLTSYHIFDTVSQEHLLNENHVFLVGFNRIGRCEINKIVNDTIEGNIMFLKIGKDAFYSENVLGRDSLLFAGKFHK